MHFFEATKQKQFYEIYENSTFYKTINHPYFRRLLNISQTSLDSDCFINHNHNRYQHSIGTCIEIQEILDLPNFNSNLISKEDQEKVQFMGLCHDLGHGPFSHLLEHQILPKIGLENFNHENYSVQLASIIYENLEDPTFGIKDIEQIINSGGKNLKNEIYNLVSNKKFGVDCDRIDYLQRDSFFAGLNLSVNFSKLKNSIFLTDDYTFDNKDISMGILASGIPNLYDFLNSRQFMFENVYVSPQSQTLQILKADLIVEAAPLINLKSRIEDIEKYVELTDMIIENINLVRHKDKKVNDLYMRLMRNDRYHFICQFQISKDLLDKLKQCDSHIQNLNQIKKYIFEKEKFNGNLEDIILMESFSNNYKDVDFDKIMVKDDLKDGSIVDLNQLEYNSKDFQFQKVQTIYYQIYVKEQKQFNQVKKYLEKLFSKDKQLHSPNFDRLAQICKEIKKKFKNLSQLMFNKIYLIFLYNFQFFCYKMSIKQILKKIINYQKNEQRRFF